jgi:hypothetical protein
MNESSLAIDVNLMFKTAYPEIYEELCQKRKLFRLEIHLFASALAIGILNKMRSQKKPTHDIVRLNQLLKEEHSETKEVINILSQMVYAGPDKHARGDAILAYADGGLEILWKDYQAQGILDLPRILADSKKKWSNRISELSHSLEENAPTSASDLA